LEMQEAVAAMEKLAGQTGFKLWGLCCVFEIFFKLRYKAHEKHLNFNHFQPLLIKHFFFINIS
jgi:hypothetical protein